MKDKVTPELRKIEKEVDNYYKSNPLMNLPFGTTAWYLLAFAEDKMLKDHVDAVGTQHYAMIGDNLVNDLKYSMFWLHDACEPGGQAPFAYNNDFYKASWDLFKLGQEYRWFVAAFTHASNGWIRLELQGSTIQPTENLFTSIEYEAYNRLIKPHKSQEALSSINFDNFPIDAIRHSLKINGDRFKYKINPKMVSDIITALIRPALDEAFSLPSEWKFSHYTLRDFRKVFEAISAIARIHATARRMAADRRCLGMGYADSIYVRPFNDLLRQVVRYSGVSESKVQSILNDLSYGREIRHPDPALQPLIKLNAKDYAIMPHLWIACSPERNLAVLLNKLPSEKKTYSKLVDEKEELMRKRFTTSLSAKDFRFICGGVQGLPDVDLAVISDSEKTCLLLELKWFIYPAEVREIIEKSKEIEKGISQLRKLKDAFANNHESLLKKLEIDSSYRLEGVVVSENWIGHAKVQSPEIPVIQADNLIEKLKLTESLESVVEWLKARKYLPTEGEHFEVPRFNATIGNWSVKWYGIKPLIEDAFFPL